MQYVVPYGDIINLYSVIVNLFNDLKALGKALNSLTFNILSSFGIVIPLSLVPLTNTLFFLMLIYLTYRYFSDVGKYLILMYIFIIVLLIIGA